MKKIIALFCLVLFFLTGCTKKVPESSGANTENTPSAKKEIIFYNLFDPEATLKGQLQAFQSAHKEINVVYKKFQNVEEYETFILNELAEGKGPDIFAIRNDWLPKYQGKLTPAPAQMYVPEKYKETFLGVAGDDLIAPDESGIDRIWGIPLFIDTLAIYYNKQLFRDNLPSTNKPADNWNDIKEQVFALTKSDTSIERFTVSGMAMGLATNIAHFADILSLLLVQEGTDLYDAGWQKAIFSKSKGVSAATGKPFFPALEALQLYTGFANPSSRHASWNLPITAFYPEQKEIGAFARGKVAMIFGYSSTYEEIKLAIDGFARENEPTIKLEEVGISEVPQFEGSVEVGKQDAFAKYYPLVVSKNSPNADVAWELLQFLSLPDSLAAYNEQTHKPTSRQDMIEEQSIDELYGAFARQAPYAKSLQTIEPEAFERVFADIVDQIGKTQISLEQGVQTAEKRMTCVLAKRQKPELEEDCFAL